MGLMSTSGSGRSAKLVPVPGLVGRSHLPYILLLLTLVTNGLLLRSLYQCGARTQSYIRRLEATPGSRVPELRGMDLRGRPLSVPTTGDRKTLLLVFSPDCGYCDQNWPRWRALTAPLAGPVNLVFVNLTATLDENYVARHRMVGYPVLTRVDPASKYHYKLNFTPQTILIGRRGVVEKVWSGMLSDRALAEAKAAIAQ